MKHFKIEMVVGDELGWDEPTEETIEEIAEHVEKYLGAGGLLLKGDVSVYEVTHFE